VTCNRFSSLNKYMNKRYKINVLSCEEIHELPGAWTTDDLKKILESVDFDGWDEIDPNELKDYTIMALQDMEADEAAEVILKYKFEERLKSGQIQNMAHEMMDEKLWEEYTDINMHAELFNCSVILKWAFPNAFPETDAIKCVLELEAEKSEVLAPITKTFLTRLLANGMDDHALLNRLFKDQIIKSALPEAEGIIWDFNTAKEGSKTVITIFSSEYWLHDMDEVSSYTSEAFSD